MNHPNVDRVGQRWTDRVEEVVTEVHTEVGRCLHLEEINARRDELEVCKELLLNSCGEPTLERPIEVVRDESYETLPETRDLGSGGQGRQSVRRPPRGTEEIY